MCSETDKDLIRKIRKTVVILLLVIVHIAGSFSCAIGKAEADAEEYAIVVSAHSSSAERYAAETLLEYLNLMNQGNCGIITDDR